MKNKLRNCTVSVRQWDRQTNPETWNSPDRYLFTMREAAEIRKKLIGQGVNKDDIRVGKLLT